MSVYPISKRMFADVYATLKEGKNWHMHLTIKRPHDLDCILNNKPMEFVMRCEHYNLMTLCLRDKRDIEEIVVDTTGYENGKILTNGQLLKFLECIDYNIDLEGWLTPEEYESLPFKTEYKNLRKTLMELQLSVAHVFVRVSDEYVQAKWAY